MVDLGQIKYMGQLTNCTIGPVYFKVGGGEVCKVKVMGMIAILTGICSCTVTC